jgi:GNAT superfamily N-acetyltransferase
VPPKRGPTRELVKRIRFRKLSRRYLDLEFFSGASSSVRIVERPGLWMGADQTNEMVEQLRSVVSRVLGGRSLDYGVFTGEKQALDRAIVTLLAERSSGAPIGFNALSLLPVTLRGRDVGVIHLGLAMVDPAYRGRGLSSVLYGLTCMLIFFRNQLRPIWFTNVSQVPSVVGNVAETFSNVFPSPDPRKRRSYDHLVIARELMKSHRRVFGVGEEAGFDERRFVITHAYTGGSDNLKHSFADVQPHRMEAYNEMCRRELDYESGDDFLQVGQIDLTTARNFLLRDVPRAWLRSLAYPLFFLLVGHSFLPVLHWLSPGRMMGDLRPRR